MTARYDLAGLGPSGTVCAACGAWRSPGELLLVIDRLGEQADAAVCRHTVAPFCLRWAGRREHTQIRLFDEAAARAHDAAGAAIT